MKQELVKKLPLDKIIISNEIQSRVALNGESINEYAKRIDAGDKFPAIVVYHDETSGTYLLADGFHRYEAHKKIGKTEINVEVKIGGKSEALMFGIVANVKHGLHRSNDDKRRSVMLLLNDLDPAVGPTLG